MKKAMSILLIIGIIIGITGCEKSEPSEYMKAKNGMSIEEIKGEMIDHLKEKYPSYPFQAGEFYEARHKSALTPGDVNADLTKIHGKSAPK